MEDWAHRMCDWVAKKIAMSVEVVNGWRWARDDREISLRLHFVVYVVRAAMRGASCDDVLLNRSSRRDQIRPRVLFNTNNYRWQPFFCNPFGI